MANEKQYAQRDVESLDARGGHYFRHVRAMTAEGLHSKSDIAAELAWRDAEIEHLKQLLESRGQFAYTFDLDVEWAGEPAAGLAAGSESIRVQVRHTNDPEFASWMREQVEEWYDGALVGVTERTFGGRT